MKKNTLFKKNDEKHIYFDRQCHKISMSKSNDGFFQIFSIVLNIDIL